MSRKKFDFNPGDKFWRITLLEPRGRGRHYGRIFKVQCDCGTIIENYRVNRLVANPPCKSCGCLRKEMRSGPQLKKRTYSEATKVRCYSMFVKTVRAREAAGFKCDEWPEDIWFEMVSRPCHYCGKTDVRNAAWMMRTCSKHYAEFPDEEIRKYDLKINSIDRVDSTKGYLFSNSVSCCGRCNKAKLHYTQDEFYDMIVAIYNHRGLHARR